jgi:sugar/nucleoside kinase (ribokinase family)
MAFFKPGCFIVIGDATMDFVAAFDKWPRDGENILIDNLKMSPGGTGLNVAIGLSRLGLETHFWGRLSDDFLGDYLRNFTLSEQVILNNIAPSNKPTRIIVVKLDRNRQPSFLAFNKPAAEDDLVESVINVETLKTASALYVSGLSLRFEPARTTVLKCMEIAKDAGVVVAFDPNLRSSEEYIPTDYREVLLKALSLTDIYLPNSIEDKLIRGHYLTLEQEVDVSGLLPDRPPICVVKCGAQGCYLLSDVKAAHFSVMNSDVIDATGAGDAFNVGFLFGLNSGFSLEDSCRIANVVAALKCKEEGTSLAFPRIDELGPYLSGLNRG